LSLPLPWLRLPRLLLLTLLLLTLLLPLTLLLLLTLQSKSLFHFRAGGLPGPEIFLPRFFLSFPLEIPTISP